MKNKTIVNLRILEKYNIGRKHLILPLIFVIVFLINPKYFVFGVLTVLSGTFSFFHDRYNRSPIDFKMPLVIGIMITRYYGLPFTALFFILSDILPSLLGGGRIEANTIIFVGWYFLINSLVLVFPQADIITLGLILVLIEAFGSVMIQRFFGIPVFLAIGSSIFSVMTRIIYFMTLGGLLQLLFSIT